MPDKRKEIPEPDRRRWRYGLKEIALARGTTLCQARYAKRFGDLRPWDLRSVAAWITCGILAEKGGVHEQETARDNSNTERIP